MAMHKSVIQQAPSPSWMSTSTVQVTKILGAWQTIATPPNVISAFPQPGLQLNWDRGHHVFVMVIELATVPMLERERTVDELKRQQY
jgi:hypothetical protein